MSAVRCDGHHGSTPRSRARLRPAMMSPLASAKPAITVRECVMTLSTCSDSRRRAIGDKPKADQAARRLRLTPAGCGFRLDARHEAPCGWRDEPEPERMAADAAGGHSGGVRPVAPGARGLPEREAVLAEKCALFPAGCFTLATDGHLAGYCFSHPWTDAPPRLDSFLGTLPAAPSRYFIHDVTLDDARGHGTPPTLVPVLAGVARDSRRAAHDAGRGERRGRFLDAVWIPERRR